MGRLYAPVPGLPRPGTFGACAPCTASSHNRVRPPSGPYATQSETPKESVAPCPRELTGENSPHIYRGEKTGKPHQKSETFFYGVVGSVLRQRSTIATGLFHSAAGESGCMSCSKGNRN